MSYFRTAILLAALTALFMGIGYLIGGQAGMVIALLVAGGMNLFAYWNSDKMVLSHVRRARGRRALGAGALRAGAAARRRGGAADAAGLCHGEPAAERLCHRPQSRSTPPSPSRPACSTPSATRSSPA